MTELALTAAGPAAVVDASVWISRFIAQDVHHRPSRQWLETHLTAGGRVLAPTLLLAEVGGAVVRRVANPMVARQIVRDIIQLPASHLVSVDQQLGASAAWFAVDLRLRGADSVYVAVAHRLQIPLITWDREQLTRTVGWITARTP